MYNPYQQNYPMNYNQTSDFIPVPNEAYARNYPVQPGHSVTFKDESQQYVYYSKTMGSSQFDTPIFKRYRLVEEALEQTQIGQNKPETDNADNSALEPLNAKIEALENEIEGIKKKLSVRRKKEVEDDTE